MIALVQAQPEQPLPVSPLCPSNPQGAKGKQKDPMHWQWEAVHDRSLSREGEKTRLQGMIQNSKYVRAAMTLFFWVTKNFYWTKGRGSFSLTKKKKKTRIRLRIRLSDKIDNLILMSKNCATLIFLTVYALFEAYEVIFSIAFCSNYVLSFYQRDKWILFFKRKKEASRRIKIFKNCF